MPENSDCFILKFISTAWKRVATRCEIDKKGPLFLSYRAGCATGGLVRRLGLGERYLDAAVLCILQDWSFRSKNLKNWKENKTFYDGVRLGFEGNANENLYTDREEVIDAASDDGLDDSFLQELEQAAAGFEVSNDVPIGGNMGTSSARATYNMDAAPGSHKEDEDLVMLDFETPKDVDEVDVTMEDTSAEEGQEPSLAVSNIANDGDEHMCSTPTEYHMVWTGM